MCQRVCLCACVCFCRLWYKVVFVCVCVCEGSRYKNYCTHIHEAEYSIWLPCTRRVSFRMPISCRAYWLNPARAPTRPTDSAQTKPKPQLSYSYRYSIICRCSCGGSIERKSCLHQFWRFAFEIQRNIRVPLLASSSSRRHYCYRPRPS